MPRPRLRSLPRALGLLLGILSLPTPLVAAPTGQGFEVAPDLSPALEEYASRREDVQDALQAGKLPHAMASSLALLARAETLPWPQRLEAAYIAGLVSLQANDGTRAATQFSRALEIQTREAPPATNLAMKRANLASQAQLLDLLASAQKLALRPALAAQALGQALDLYRDHPEVAPARLVSKRLELWRLVRSSPGEEAPRQAEDLAGTIRKLARGSLWHRRLEVEAGTAGPLSIQPLPGERVVLVDARGQARLGPFEEARPHPGGLWSYRLHGQVGLVREDGVEVLPAVFEEIRVAPGRPDRLVVERKWMTPSRVEQAVGILDLRGRAILPLVHRGPLECSRRGLALRAADSEERVCFDWEGKILPPDALPPASGEPRDESATDPDPETPSPGSVPEESAGHDPWPPGRIRLFEGDLSLAPPLDWGLEAYDLGWFRLRRPATPEGPALHLAVRTLPPADVTTPDTLHQEISRMARDLLGRATLHAAGFRQVGPRRLLVFQSWPTDSSPPEGQGFGWTAQWIGQQETFLVLLWAEGGRPEHFQPHLERLLDSLRTPGEDGF